MNKTELINAVAETSGLTKKDSEVALNAILDTIQDAMKNGDKVQLVGFGSFEVKERLPVLARILPPALRLRSPHPRPRHSRPVRL